MSHQTTDFSILDRPDILEIIFRPWRDSPEIPPWVTLHSIPVEHGVQIACRFCVAGSQFPTILYFHGNGETAGDYDFLAPHYHVRGMNLFVADYRGYGLSEGRPTISNLMRDAHVIFDGLGKMLEEGGFRKSLFVMGRSLGSLSAVELAFHHQERLRGLIVESGSANNFLSLLCLLGLPADHPLWDEMRAFSNKVKVRSIAIPTLIIHGEYDSLISAGEGKEHYENSAAPDKSFLTIPGADHNELLQKGIELYFETIADFVRAHG